MRYRNADVSTFGGVYLAVDPKEGTGGNEPFLGFRLVDLGKPDVPPDQDQAAAQSTDFDNLFPKDGNTKVGIDLIKDLYFTCMYPSSAGQIRYANDRSRTIALNVHGLDVLDFAHPNADTEYEKHLKLGSSDFELYNDLAKRPDEKADLKPRMRPPYQFADYPTVAYIQAQFITHDALFPSGNKLLVTVRYILTKYSLTPAHEPGGLLSAARLFPLITYALVGPDGQVTEDPDIRAVRFDYRINYSLDVFLPAPDPKTFKAGTRQLSEKEWIALLHKPQQAGLFRDIEGVDLPPEKIFYAAEKPLVYEVVGHGLNEGVPGTIGPESPGSTQVIRRTTWDNIHWWGGYRRLHIPSAPGAFHAAHLHWRWGASQQVPGILPEFGKPQFIGGHGLVDPKLPNQTIIVAVCLKDSIKDTKANFEESFTLDAVGKDRIPEKIEDGASIELWYSTEIRAGLLYPSNEGCVFIHGLFFSHDPEPRLVPGQIGRYIATGPEKPQYVPAKPSAAVWVRNPVDQ